MNFARAVLLLAMLTPASSSAPPRLALLTSTEISAGDERVVNGEVQNISSEPIAGIVVTATWYDKDRKAVGSNIGLLKDEPLEPNQRTTYSVSMKAKPTMAGYLVTFKNIHDNTPIPFADRREKR